MSDEAILVLAKTFPINILADKMRRIYFHRPEYNRTNSSFKSVEMKELIARTAVTMGEQIKGKMDISPCSLYNPLDRCEAYNDMPQI